METNHRGVLQPQQARQFIVESYASSIYDIAIVTDSIESVEVDYKNNLFTLKIRQAVSPLFLDAVQDIMRQQTSEWKIAYVESFGNPLYKQVFRGCSLQSATAKLDYADAGHLYHYWIYSFKSYGVIGNSQTLNDTEVPKVDGDLTPEEAITMLKKMQSELTDKANNGNKILKEVPGDGKKGK